MLLVNYPFSKQVLEFFESSFLFLLLTVCFDFGHEQLNSHPICFCQRLLPFQSFDSPTKRMKNVNPTKKNLLRE
jgi:hypothetical protein